MALDSALTLHRNCTFTAAYYTVEAVDSNKYPIQTYIGSAVAKGVASGLSIYNNITEEKLLLASWRDGALALFYSGSSRDI
uniref:Uncharacterized protein n=1 Tax=Arundo donax TaxID=35708 RepID=A0A0A9GD11_ARUDO